MRKYRTLTGISDHIIDSRKATKVDRLTKQCECGNYTDEYKQCDWCVLEKYDLIDYLCHDSCDQIGLGPEYINKDEVLRALREAELVT